MSEQQQMNPLTVNEAPQTIYLKDYQVPNFLIDEIDLYFNLNDEHTIVSSRLRIRRNRLSPHRAQELILNGEDLILESITLDGELLPPSKYAVVDQRLIIHEPPENFELAIVTKIYPQKNTQLSGLYRSKDTYCTQCEAQGFRRITYFIDQPDILCRYTTTIEADEKRYPYLLSNGNLADLGKLENGRHWAKWEDPFKKPSYLFALVAGDFEVVEDTFTTQSGRAIDLRIYVDKAYVNQTAHTMHSVKEAMRWDEKTYGREYDLDIYMIVAIGDFNMGAMENKGLNIFNTKYVLATPATATDDDYINIMSVVGHEYFHNWSGNRVTCRDWFQLSLKEGLTIFRDQTFTEDMLSHAVIRIRDVIALRESQFPEDAGPLSHPVRPESYIEINNFYTATVYNKGAEVLRMLRTILGESLFRKGMDLYFARHDGQAVTIEDYIKTMEDVSGIDLKQFRLWYSQAGTPIVSVAADYDASQKLYTLTINQVTKPTPSQPEKYPLFIPIKMGLLNHQGEAVPLQMNDNKTTMDKVLWLTKASQNFQFKKVETPPIPSLLRNFSAPVILNYPYSDKDLLFLFKQDKDAFNRWEAGQKYALRIILNLVRDYQQQKALTAPSDLLEVFDYILNHNTEDKFFLAELLTLPSEKYIGEQMTIVDVNAIHAAREFVLTTIAQQVQKPLLLTYQNNHEPNQPYTFTMAAVGKRQLKNRCLSYLLKLPEHADLGLQQFTQSLTNNMTDTQTAFVGLTNLETPHRADVIEQFYTTWHEQPLVVDKWLAIQAASILPTALQQVKKLMRHEAFDIKNPNKVYSLIGTFGARNQINFHAEDGEGYAFLRDVVQQLDKLNPQVAAKMVKPLTMWKRYDKERQTLMRAQLELLLQDKKISSDLYEIVSKSMLYDNEQTKNPA